MPRYPVCRAATLLLALLATSLVAQEPTTGDSAAVPAEPATTTVMALVGGDVRVAPGRTLLGATVLVRDGLIVAVGSDVEVPAGAEVVDATGMVVAPAFIDLRNTGLIEDGTVSNGPAGADDRAADVLRAFDGERCRTLLRAGIGAVYATVPPQPGRAMTGALVVPDPAAPTPTLVDGMAGVEFAFGGGPDLRSRMASAGSVDKAVSGARRYHKALEKYRKDFAEYEEKLAEWKKEKVEGASGKTSGKPKEESGGKDSAGSSALPPDFRKWPASKRFEYMKKRREAASGKPDESKPGAAKSGSGSERPKAPRPVTLDPGSEALLRVLEGKTPLRIEAHWKQDILAAIAAARKASAPLVIVGCTEGRQVLDELKEARVRVVLGAPAPFGSHAPDRPWPQPGLARALAAAGIPFGFMTAGESDFGPDDLPLVAALHVGAGLDEEAAFTALTLGAARVLGRDATLGTLEPGRVALIQVVTGDPLTPTTRVHAMVLGTKVVKP